MHVPDDRTHVLQRSLSVEILLAESRIQVERPIRRNARPEIP